MTDTTTPERREILQRARAVRTLAKHRRWAEEMRAAGWTVDEPEPPCGAVYVDPRGGDRPPQAPCGKVRGHEEGPETDWKRGYHSNGLLKWPVKDPEREGPMEPGGLSGDGMK